MQESHNDCGALEEIVNLRQITDDERERVPRAEQDVRSENWGASGVAAMCLGRSSRKGSDESGNCSDGWDASGVAALLGRAGTRATKPEVTP